MKSWKIYNKKELIKKIAQLSSDRVVKNEKLLIRLCNNIGQQVKKIGPSGPAGKITGVSFNCVDIGGAVKITDPYYHVDFKMWDNQTINTPASPNILQAVDRLVKL